MESVEIVLFKSILLNIFMATIKIISGVFGGSNTLVCDGVHTITNIVTEFFAILGHKASNKKADKRHPLGYEIIENVTLVGIGIVIVFAGITLVENSFRGEGVIPNIWITLVVILCIILKIFSYRTLSKKGAEYSSNILSVASKETIIDAFSSVFTLVIIIISQFKINSSFIKYFDVIGSLVIAALIIYTGVRIILDEVSKLIVKKESNTKVKNDFLNIIKEYKDIKEIKSFDLIRHGKSYEAIIELVCNNRITFLKANKIRCEIEKKVLLEIEEIKLIAIKMIPEE